MFKTNSDALPVKVDVQATTAVWLPIPVIIPKVLSSPRSEQRKRAAIAGILTGILASLALGRFTPSNNVLSHMFNFRAPSAAVAYSILSLFCWALALSLDQLRRLNALERLDGADLRSAIIGALRTNGVKALYEALNVEATRYSPLLRRVQLTLEQWLIAANLQNASLAIEQQVILDRESTQRNYNLLRLIVWATPVLGLVGTVVGISIAVGGFASFLATNIEDVARIKAGLIHVTGGLSFSFMVTLEGLLASLLVMLATSSLQTREERYYADVDRYTSEEFLPLLQRTSPERDPRVVQEPEAWSAAMAEASQAVMVVIDDAGKRMLREWSEQHSHYMSGLANVRDALERSAEIGVASFNETGAMVGAQLRDSAKAEAVLFEELRSSAREHLEMAALEIKAAAGTVAFSLSEIVVQITSHLSAAMADFEESANSQRVVIQHAVVDAKQALERYSDEVARSSGAVTELGSVTSRVLDSQAVLQLAIDQLGSSSLATVLSDLDSSLRDLAPVLANLSQPFVLQAVPVIAMQKNGLGE